MCDCELQENCKLHDINTYGNEYFTTHLHRLTDEALVFSYYEILEELQNRNLYDSNNKKIIKKINNEIIRFS